MFQNGYFSLTGMLVDAEWKAQIPAGPPISRSGQVEFDGCHRQCKIYSNRVANRLEPPPSYRHQTSSP